MNTPGKPNRILYIDYLRGWAVILMIFWHLIDATLSEIYRNSVYFSIAKFIGGLVAPTFLFAAGAAFSIILSKRKDAILKLQKPVLKQLFRILQILLIAYFLHFNWSYLGNMNMPMNTNDFLMLIQSDVLHVIALGLFLLLIMLILLRSEAVFYSAVVLLSVIIILLTPYIYEIEFIKDLPIYLAAFLNKKFNSQFPIFPWLAYLFFGAVVMKLLLDYNKKQKEDIFLKYLFITGIIFVLLGLIPELLSFKTTAYYNFWLTSPNIFLIRMGIIFISIFLLKNISSGYNYRMKLFGIFGLESLFVYVVHLLMVYGKDSPITFSHYIGNSVNWFEFFAIYALFLFFLLFITRFYHKLKLDWGKIKTGK
jgi:uncharacterized membrane protein